VPFVATSSELSVKPILKLSTMAALFSGISCKFCLTNPDVGLIPQVKGEVF